MRVLNKSLLGFVGVNLIYGAFYQHDRPRKMLRYLFDHIDKTAIEIDTIILQAHCLRISTIES
ncbi:MAG: hypothetical protein CM15mP83_9340 [Flavobacteriaceae bacterium]|nr:MAG: hypothetical protein CM15mP83_9340 [Flavobacteriaceae bacterium]